MLFSDLMTEKLVSKRGGDGAVYQFLFIAVVSVTLQERY